MTEETRFRIALDTEQAKQSLRSLVSSAGDLAESASTSIRSAVGRGLGIAGLSGVAFGAGMAALRGATESGIGDVVGEALGGWGREIENWALGDMAMEARAKRATREEAINAFGAVVGRTNQIPQGAKSWFDNVYALRKQEESGRYQIETHSDFRGPGIEKVVDRIMEQIGRELAKAVDLLADKLAFWR